MDLNPTPFPGKHRPVAAMNPAKKDRDRTKLSSQQAPQPPQTRQLRRTFGTTRNPNIPVDKPSTIATKICSKPRKPSGNDTIYASGSAKKKVDGKKSQHVSFQEPPKEAAGEIVAGTEKCLRDDGANTPVSSAKTEDVGTPYLSAENCSKCRFDKLETSAYWLSQIKIAELAGKHFVSTAFFRLAVECHAQPFHSLQREFKQYMVRHKSPTLWGDLCQLYGVSDEQPRDDSHELDKLDAVLVEQEDCKDNGQYEGNCQALEDECFEFDFVENPALEKETTKLMDTTNLTVENDNDDKTDELVNVKLPQKPAKDSPLKSAGLKPPEGNAGHEKSKYLPSNSSSLNANRGRLGQSSSAWKHNQPELKSSCDKLAKVTVRAKSNRGKIDESTASSLSDNNELESSSEDAQTGNFQPGPTS